LYTGAHAAIGHLALLTRDDVRLPQLFSDSRDPRSHEARDVGEGSYPDFLQTPEIYPSTLVKSHYIALRSVRERLLPDFSAMPEVFVSNADLAAAVSREVKAGTLRRIGSRLYTRNLKDPPEEIVLRNLWPLVAAYLPGALIADRTAMEYRPAPDGSVFLVADHKRDIILPGVILRPRKGAPPGEYAMVPLPPRRRPYLAQARHRGAPG
jgi:hypothetical protein